MENSGHPTSTEYGLAIQLIVTLFPLQFGIKSGASNAHHQFKTVMRVGVEIGFNLHELGTVWGFVRAWVSKN